MTRLKGKVISRPLTMVPTEGAQVLRYRFGSTHPGDQILDTITAVFGNRIEFKATNGYQVGIEGLYELYVTSGGAAYTPLKYSQWQAAIANGEVDSDKLVEFELIYATGGYSNTGRPPVRLAKIIPAKPVAEDWDDVRLLYGQFIAKTNSTLTFFEWLKQHYNPPTKIKQ